MAKAKPDNPFTLVGAPSAAGPFVRTGASPNAALLHRPRLRRADRRRAARRARLAPLPHHRDLEARELHDLRGLHDRNAASGAAWAGLDQAWGAWTATPTTAGGGDGVETTVRFLPDTVALADRGPWTVTCTFTNTYHAPTPPATPATPTTPPASGTIAGRADERHDARPTPAAPVTPSSTPRAGTARAVGSTGCVIGASAIVDVRGRGIVRVTFKLNGKTVKTLTNDNVAGMYRLRVPAQQPPARHEPRHGRRALPQGEPGRAEAARVRARTAARAARRAHAVVHGLSGAARGPRRASPPSAPSSAPCGSTASTPGT